MQTTVPIVMSSILFYNERLPATGELQSPFLDILKEHSQKLFILNFKHFILIKLCIK